MIEGQLGFISTPDQGSLLVDFKVKRLLKVLLLYLDLSWLNASSSSLWSATRYRGCSIATCGTVIDHNMSLNFLATIQVNPSYSSVTLIQ